MKLCHLTIGQLDEILALAKVVQRDWNSMSDYLRLDVLGTEHRLKPPLAAPHLRTGDGFRAIQRP